MRCLHTVIMSVMSIMVIAIITVSVVLFMVMFSVVITIVASMPTEAASWRRSEKVAQRALQFRKEKEKKTHLA